MKITTLTMIEADDGMVLTKDGIYSASVLLRKGETPEGWSEITREEYDLIQEQSNDNNDAD